MAPNPSPHAAGLNGAVVRQIKAEMAARGVTADSLAKKLEMHPTQLSRYLNFQRELKVRTLEDLAAALEIPQLVLLRRALSERKE